MARLVKIAAAPVKRRPRRPPPVLYIGAWLRRLGLKQVDIARAADIGESHMSLIISGNKYPSMGVLDAIALAMGVTVETLRKPPPDDATIKAVAGIDPAILVRLGKNRLKN